MIVINLWRRRRVFLFEAMIFGESFERHYDPAAACTDALEKHALSNLARYDVTVSRASSRDLEEFKRLRAMMAAEPDLPNESEVLQAFEAQLDTTSVEKKDVDIDVEHDVAKLDENLPKDPSLAVLPQVKVDSDAPSLEDEQKDVDVELEHGAANPDESSQNDPSSAFVLVESDGATSDKKIRLPFFITKSAKAQLRELGFSNNQIAKMKPEHAQKILGL